MSQDGRGPGRPATPPSAARRAVPAGIVALVTGVLLGGAGLAAHAGLTGDTVPAGVGRAVSFDDLRVTVTAFERRVDAVAGVNSEALPLSGPAMPMGMNSMGVGEAPHDMSSMPGMAGMLHAGQERVDVRLDVFNDGDRRSDLSAERFWLSSAGRPVPLLQPTTSEIRGQLTPGFSLTGTVTFVIPEGTAPLVLHYADHRTGVLLDAGGGAHDHGDGGSRGHHGDDTHGGSS